MPDLAKLLDLKILAAEHWFDRTYGFNSVVNERIKIWINHPAKRGGAIGQMLQDGCGDYGEWESVGSCLYTSVVRPHANSRFHVRLRRASG